MSKVLLFLLAFGCACQGWKLNVRRVLLPLAEEGAKFRVFSEGISYRKFIFFDRKILSLNYCDFLHILSYLGGCFIWISTRPEIVKVSATKVAEECGNIVPDTFSPPRLVFRSNVQ